MSRIIKMANLKNLQVMGGAMLIVASLDVYSVVDPLEQRDQALRQQYSRVNEVILIRSNEASSQRISYSGNVSTAQSASSSNRIIQTASGLGVIQLSQDAVINQQLNQGMNDARASLKKIKVTVQGSEGQEYQRDLAVGALDQIVEAYLACRAEANVPINSHYERDPFLKEMIVIKQKLTKEKLQAVAVTDMLDRLAVARNKLVKLTERMQ